MGGLYKHDGRERIKMGIFFGITWAPFSRSLRALTADKKPPPMPPPPLVTDTIGSTMGGAVDADGVVD
jgi:hypothetical protein